jgi:peptide/nickel transport system substrate-binding protein
MSAGNIPFPSTPPNEGYEGYRFVGNNIYDGLTKYNLDQDEEIPSPQPALAESWEVSEDQLTWTFKLREDVTFHDGTRFDADAVIFQFERERNKDSEYYDAINAPRYAATFAFFKSWTKVDDFTVQFTTEKPYAWMLHDLAHIKYPSPTVVREVGNEAYNQHATGTGPFKMTRYVDGEVMELSRNDEYWGEKAKLDEIVLYPQAEPASRLSALQSGEVDWAEVPSPDAVDQLESEGYQVFLGKYPHGIMPRFNMFKEPWKSNLPLRQALNYALDREGTNALINDVGYAATQYVYEDHPDYAEGNPGYSYDVDKAKDLLAEAGIEPGELSLKVGYPTGGSGNMFPGPMMEKLQADFKAIGVNVELMPMEWNTLITIGVEGLDKPQWSHIDVLWASPAAGMTPTGYRTSFMCERPGPAPNAAGTCNPAMDAAYLAASAEFDEEASHGHLQRMMDVAVDNAYFLFWMHDLNLRVMSPDVKGYVHPQSWWVDFTTIWVES